MNAICSFSGQNTLHLRHAQRSARPGISRQRLHVAATWSRPMPDRDADFVKPSYVPTPGQAPEIQYPREDRPLYQPFAPEFTPPEQPSKPDELKEAPKMPERRPDPIPASRPKERPPTPGEPDKREAPPPKETEAPKP